MVGFENTVYSVAEDIHGGVLELCAIVYTSNFDIQCSNPFILQANIPTIGIFIKSLCCFNMKIFIYWQVMISHYHLRLVKIAVVGI